MPPFLQSPSFLISTLSSVCSNKHLRVRLALKLRCSCPAQALSPLFVCLFFLLLRVAPKLRSLHLPPHSFYVASRYFHLNPPFPWCLRRNPETRAPRRLFRHFRACTDSCTSAVMPLPLFRTNAHILHLPFELYSLADIVISSIIINHFRTLRTPTSRLGP